MKVTILFLFCTMLTGCLAPTAFKYPQPMENSTENYSSTLAVSCYKELGYDTCTDFSLFISNKTNNNLKINWNESAMVKDGVSSQLVPAGTKFSNASESKQNTIIPASMDITTNFVPANNIYFSFVTNSWAKYLVSSGNYTMLFAIENGEVRENLKFSFVVGAP